MLINLQWDRREEAHKPRSSKGKCEYICTCKLSSHQYNERHGKSSIFNTQRENSARYITNEMLVSITKNFKNQ